jgi:hypothetical protein
MVTGLKGITYEERCAELGLETLERRRDIQDIVGYSLIIATKVVFTCA